MEFNSEWEAESYAQRMRIQYHRIVSDADSNSSYQGRRNNPTRNVPFPQIDMRPAQTREKLARIPVDRYENQKAPYIRAGNRRFSPKFVGKRERKQYE